MCYLQWFFSLILFPNLTSPKSINVFWMIWIQAQFSLFWTQFNWTFSFENTYTDVVIKVLNNLNVAKTCQVNDIPAKVIKGIFANFITDHFKYCIAYGEFPDELKQADVIPVHKKNEKCNKKITDQWASWPTFQKFMRNYCITGYLNTLTVY